MPTAKSKHLGFDYLLHFSALTLSLLVLSLSMFLLSNYLNQKPEIKVLGAQVDLEKEKQFWLEIIGKSPTYRDGWVELAKIEKDLGNTQLSKKYLDKAIEIDPNYNFVEYTN